MKVILFKKNQIEIGRLIPDKRTMLVGRAPVCDLVIRKKDLKPIHFIIEWMGEGSFDPYVGFWSIIDISYTDVNVKRDSYSGEASILTETPIIIGDFQVSIEDEKLAASPISKGTLTRSLDIENAESGTVKPEMDRVLELVTYNTEIDVVTSVNHFPKDLLQKGIKISSLPKVNFSYSAQAANLLTIENMGDENVLDLYNRADRIIEKFKNVNDKITVDEDDFYLLYSPENAYYIRWVNKHEVHTPPSAWKKDPVVVTLIIVTIFMFFLGIGIKFIDRPITTEIPKPQRVAKVEVLDFAPRPEEAPPLPVYEQEVKKEEIKTPPIEKPEEMKAAKPVENPEEAPQKSSTKDADKTAAQNQKVIQQQGKRATIKNIDENLELAQGLNQKGEIKNVNSVGLLGKLGGAKKIGSGLSAEAVIAKVKPADSASGEAGKVQVLQPPTGKVNLTNTGRTQADDDDGAGLSAASTTLKMDNVAKGTKISGLASSKATGSVGTAAFGGSQKEGGSDSIQSLGGSVSLETKAMEVQGGLTKEQVRQAISDNKRALRNCHEQFLTFKKDLGGRIVLRWKINGEGPVDTISTQASNTGYPNFDSCVNDIIKKIVFPKAPNGNSTIVIYPFLFQPKK
ncbi:MAG: AgmX/PglI C-terminal domain-containing protein [Bdellovibrionaceae bacterium]|nr:AgmX/PglI C-terminal domain-containing protein [Pseudobdellovibrionaceae bacterium]